MEALNERMTVARKSTKAAEARARARERAIRFQEREQLLVKIAERFEEAQIELEQIDAATEQKVEKIRAQAEARVLEAREQASRDAAGARERAEQLQREMLDEGISRREVAERLGITTREVVRQAKAAPSGQEQGSATAEPAAGGQGR
jgi:vacuolar-type H+-ATPase subunit H